jgi:hypothetical protein
MVEHLRYVLDHQELGVQSFGDFKIPENQIVSGVVGKLAVSTELDDLSLFSVLITSKLREALAGRSANHAIEVTFGDTAVLQGIVDSFDIQEPNIFANGCGSHVVAGMVELESTESFVLDIVPERNVEPPGASEAAGRSTATAEEFRQ